MSSTGLLTIGELASKTGRRPSSIRYYEQIGLMPEPIRVGGRRRYPAETARTLTVVDTAQRAGLSLDEIRALLEAEAGGPAAIEELRRIAERKLPQLRAAIEQSLLVERWLDAATRCECPTLDDCCLFEARAVPPMIRARRDGLQSRPVLK